MFKEIIFAITNFTCDYANDYMSFLNLFSYVKFLNNN